MSYHQAGRPENVLRRAEDLINIGQPDDALQTMYTFITGKRSKNLDASNPEFLEILKLFIKLAVNSRLSKYIKEAFYQYKRKCIESEDSLKHLEDIIKYFLDLANSKLIEAQSKANSAAELAIEESVASAIAATKTIEKLESSAHNSDNEDEDDDLADENLVFNVSPEHILLSSVSTDDSTDRSNKEFFLPWLKFVWESYRSVIELLKGNKFLEDSYCQITSQAFQFCVRFDRKSEFKRLCEILKTHLISMAKPEYENAVNLSKPDTLQKFLDTRFQQLNTAVKLELWKESFKSIEEVHGLMKLSKRSPKPLLLVNYYKNLAKIFQVSNNYIYATAARQKLFQLLIQSPVITEKELKENASLLLITALSIPVNDSLDHSFSAKNNLIDDEFFKRKNIKLSALLTLNEIPTRETLLNGYTLKSVLKLADPILVNLFNSLEVNFNPLTFKSSVNSILNQISNQDKYVTFTEQLKKVIVSKIVSKVSSLYDSIKFDFLLKICTFENELFNYDEFTFEDLLINLQSSNIIKADIEIDDNSGVVRFINKLYSDDSSNINSRLYNIENALTSAISLINVEETKAKRNELKVKAFNFANENMLKEKETILETLEMVNEHEKQLNEELEQQKLEKEKLNAEETLRQKRLEEERIQMEAEKREKDRQEKLMKKIQLENNKKLVKEINDQGVIFIKFEDVKNMTEDEIKELKRDKIIAQKNKLEEQLDAIVKRQDHIERAQRLTEMKMLKDELDKEVVKQKEEYDALKEKITLQAKQAFDASLKIKERLSRTVGDYNEYVGSLEELESQELAAKREKAKKLLEEAKKARIEEFIANKKQEFEEELKRKQIEAENARVEAERAAREANSWKSRFESRNAPATTNSRFGSPSEAPAPINSRFGAPVAPAAPAVDSERAVYDAIEAKLANGEKISMAEKMKHRKLSAKYAA